MKKYFTILQSINLFADIAEEELLLLLACLDAKTVHYEKGQTVFMSGERIKQFGIVLSGEIQIVQDDYYGNRSILTKVGPGHLFAEAFAYAEIEKLPVSVITTTDSELMLIDYRKLALPCTRACDFHNRLIQNMLKIVALKNVALTQKIKITSERTTREKLLAYLSGEAKKAGSSRFQIPYNRQELADYLIVDRSAMSTELSKLQKDGVIKFHKNQFELL